MTWSRELHGENQTQFGSPHAPRLMVWQRGCQSSVRLSLVTTQELLYEIMLLLLGLLPLLLRRPVPQSPKNDEVLQNMGSQQWHGTLERTSHQQVVLCRSKKRKTSWQQCTLGSTPSHLYQLIKLGTFKGGSQSHDRAEKSCRKDRVGLRGCVSSCSPVADGRIMSMVMVYFDNEKIEGSSFMSADIEEV